MFDIEDKIIDPRTDEIGIKINAILAMPKWTLEKRKLFDELVKMLEKKEIVQFVGHPSKYHLTRIPDSCLYQVPSKRRGHLSVFRDKLVRIVCVSSGRFDRTLIAYEYK
jgi:hypothetical protein